MSVFDTSVLMKIFLEHERGHEAALALLNQHIQENKQIVVPNHLYIEFSNVIGKNKNITLEELHDIKSTLKDLPISWYQETKEDIDNASIQARKFNTSVYDTLFLVVAQKHNTQLFTSDQKFCKNCKEPDIYFI